LHASQRIFGRLRAQAGQTLNQDWVWRGRLQTSHIMERLTGCDIYSPSTKSC